MSILVVRTADRWYVLRGAEALPIDAELPSTAMFLAEGLQLARAASSVDERGVPADGLSLLSPVTAPCRVVAQAVNYSSHGSETGSGARSAGGLLRKELGVYQRTLR